MIDTLQTISRKVAVIGTARSGKTVFLTSLINHLFEHNRAEFVVGEGAAAQISDFRTKPVPKKTGDQFKYGAYRDALVHSGKWPEKTRDVSHFICDFKRSDWKFFRSKLQFFDIPGERFADVAIGEHENYPDWSDYMLDYIESDSTYRELATPLLDVQKRLPLQKSDLLAAYRETLANFFIHFKPSISPSTFILDQNGRMPDTLTQEAFRSDARSRLLGLPPGKKRSNEFAPLTEQARAKNPDLAKEFEQAYRAYRKTIVMPLLEELKSSNRLVILVDIPSLLYGGVAMYNDNRELLENLFTVLQPNSWFWRLVPMAPGKSPVNIDRIAFVATKSDIVHPKDVEGGHLLNLLKQMTERFAFSLPHIEIEWFTCSAVVSAKAADKPYTMRGTRAADTSKGETIYNVSPLPERWPDNWTQGNFDYSTVMPRIPANRGIAPEQYGLDKVFSFITKD